MSGISQILKKICFELEKVFPELTKSLNPPIKKEQVKQLEQELGFQLPDEIIELYSNYNGESKNYGFFFGLHFLSSENAHKEWKSWGKFKKLT